MSLVLEKYLEIKQKLAKYKRLELEMRASILEHQFGKGNVGIKNSEHGGYAIKGNFGMTTKIEISDDDYDVLPEHLQECIAWKPSLVKKVYDDLSEIDMEYLEEYVTTKPSLPTLTLKEIDLDE